MTTYLEQVQKITGLTGLSPQTNGKGCFMIIHQGKPIATFYLVPMPGCCGIIISTSSYIDAAYRGKGLGTLLNTLRIHMAHYLGYTMVICTDIESNEPQAKILNKNGWQKLLSFVNRRTDNQVNLHSRETEPGPFSLGNFKIEEIGTNPYYGGKFFNL